MFIIDIANENIIKSKICKNLKPDVADIIVNRIIGKYALKFTKE